MAGHLAQRPERLRSSKKKIMGNVGLDLKMNDGGPIPLILHVFDNRQPATRQPASGTGNPPTGNHNGLLCFLWGCFWILRFVCGFFMVGFGLSRVGVGFIPSGLLRVSLWFLKRFKSLFCGSFWSVFDAFGVGLGIIFGWGQALLWVWWRVGLGFLGDVSIGFFGFIEGMFILFTFGKFMV